MRLLFIIMGAISVGAALLAMKLVPEPPLKPFAPRRVDKLIFFQGRIVERTRYLPLWMYRWRYRSPLHRIRTGGEAVPRALRLYFAATLLLFSGFQTVFTPFPVFLRGPLQCSGLEVFLVYLVNSAAAAVLYSKVGEIIPNHGERGALLKANLVRVCLFAGFGLLSLLVSAGLVLPHLALLALVLLMMAGVGVFWAFVSVAATALVSNCAPPDAKGENVGLFNAMVSVGCIVGSLIGGWVALALGYTVSFFAGTGLVLAGLLVLALNRGLDALYAPAPEKEWTAP
jgi:predicted MFS family arabinose efflux permease